MADNEDLLSQAKAIQRQKLLAQAKQIQSQQLSAPAETESAPEEEDISLLGKARNLGLKGAMTAAKGLDYVGGVTRTAGTAALDELNPKRVKDTTLGDVWSAMKAKPLSGDEILSRQGVPKGGSLSDVVSGYAKPGDPNNHWYTPEKGGLIDPSARGVGGVGVEVATDPLTYLSFGMSAAAKEALANGTKQGLAKKLLNYAARPVSQAGEDTGKAIYSGAFKNVDKDLLALGKPPLAPELLNEGFVGTMKGARQKANEMRRASGKSGEQAVNKASELGADVALTETPQADKLISELSKHPDPRMQKASEKLGDILGSYKQAGTIPADIAAGYSTKLNKLAGPAAFDPLRSSEIPFQSEFDRALGSDIGNSIEKSVANTSPELGKQMNNADRVYAATKTAAKPLKREANKEATKNAVSQIDAMLLGGGGSALALGSPKAAIATAGMLAAKKAAQAGNSTLGRTMIGRGLWEGSKYAEPAIRRQSIWKDIYDKSNNKGEKE